MADVHTPSNCFYSKDHSLVQYTKGWKTTINCCSYIFAQYLRSGWLIFVDYSLTLHYWVIKSTLNRVLAYYKNRQYTKQHEYIGIYHFKSIFPKSHPILSLNKL